MVGRHPILISTLVWLGAISAPAADFAPLSAADIAAIDAEVEAKHQKILSQSRANSRKRKRLAYGRHVAQHRLDDPSPWPAPVAGHVPVQPGEHPRLLFRKEMVPVLRQRAETPEGRMILKRLRWLLDGANGDTMTTVFNPAKTEYVPNQDHQRAHVSDPGVFTIGHAAGYGLLYQLTGEQQYADFGKECFRKAIEEEQRDRDSVYNLYDSSPWRVGPALVAYAIGYDLCYEGWDPEFRAWVAKELLFLDTARGAKGTIEALASGISGHSPHANHWAGSISGAPMIALAMLNDPEADQRQVHRLLAWGKRTTIRQLTEGLGDYGFFGGGEGPGALVTDSGFVPLLQAWRVAAGLDFVNPRPVGNWTVLKYIYGGVCPNPDPDDNKPLYPQRGTYQHNYFGRTGVTGAGYFAQGFGIIDDKYKPALLWLYNRSFRDSDFAKEQPYGSINQYPHRSVMALANWPFGMEEGNPGDVLPEYTLDRHWNMVQIRDRWQDANDTVISILTRRSGGHYQCAPDIQIIHRQRVITTPVVLHGTIEDVRKLDRGWLVKTDEGCLGIDFSGASGSNFLLVWKGGKEPEELMGTKGLVATLENAGVEINKHWTRADLLRKVREVASTPFPANCVAVKRRLGPDEFVAEDKTEDPLLEDLDLEMSDQPADPKAEQRAIEAPEVLFHVQAIDGALGALEGIRITASGITIGSQGVRLDDEGWIVFAQQ